MLVFVTAVKHPDNSDSYEEVWRLLNNTLYSVCSQQDTNFRVIVVCDKQLPLYHHEKLINTYTDFVEVDFPSHGEEVIKNFNRLGNLSSPIDDPKWWNQAVVRTIKKNKNIKVDPKKIYVSSAEIKLMTNYALNRASKQLIGILAADKYDPEYILAFDADDFVASDISAYVNAHPGENGWLMVNGYKMINNLITPLYKITTFCGTGNIVSYPLLLEFIPQSISVKSTQNELFEHVDSDFFFTLAEHGKLKAFYEKKGRPLLEFPFRGVVHLLGHGESNEFVRRTIRGEEVSVRVQESEEYAQFSPINSAQVDYFNILPSNKTKVFGLGFHKTGTTSLEMVLQDMGYQVATYYKNIDPEFSKRLENGDLSEIKQMAEKYDAFQDAPWFLYYREFDQWFPGSKFILTVRESRSWWASFSYYFEKQEIPLFKTIYGFDNPKGHEEVFVKRYERHNREVIEYFKDRPDDLLVIDVSEEGALQKVSDFLGKESSYRKMPHKNASLRKPAGKQQMGRMEQIKTLAKKLKRLKAIPLIHMLVFPTPVIVGGGRESGTEVILSILSAHPKIHAINTLKLNFPTRHPLSPDRSIGFYQDNNSNTKVIDFKEVFLKLLQNRVHRSARHWSYANRLNVLVYEALLKQYGEKARIINMVRDGRDVVAEKSSRVMGRYAVDGERWVHDVREGIKFEDHPQVLTIRYEDLIKDHEGTMNRLGRFIGEKDVTPFLNYPKRAKIMHDKYWIGKWKQPQYANRVEGLLKTPGALECLQHYGYIE